MILACLRESGKKARPKKGFADFIEANKEDLDQFCGAVRQLRDERDKFATSADFNQLAEDYISLLIDVSSANTPFSAQFDRLAQAQIGDRIRRFRREIRYLLENVVFGSQAELIKLDEGLERNYRGLIARFESSMKPQHRSSWERVLARIEEFSGRVDAKLNPFQEIYRQSKQALYSNLQQYLTSYHHLDDFDQFLQASGFRAERDRIRPFLVSLAEDDLKAERGTSWLGTAATLLNEVVIQSRQQDLLEAYLRTIRDSKGETAEVWRLIRFGLRSSRPDLSEEELLADSTLAEVVDQLISYPSIWDKSLIGGYTAFVAGQISGHLRSIRGALQQLRQLDVKRTDLDDVELPGRKRPDRGQVKVRVDDSQGTLPPSQEQEQVFYPIGLLKAGANLIEPMTEDNLFAYCRDIADGLAEGDRKMADDIVAMVNSLRQQPYGSGTEKLTDRVVSVGGKRLPVRSFDPREREDLKGHLQHRLSPRIRVSYVIYGKGRGSRIGIQRIVSHDVADQIYQS